MTHLTIARSYLGTKELKGSADKADVLTRQTKEQILAHNESGAKICGWRR